MEAQKAAERGLYYLYKDGAQQNQEDLPLVKDVVNPPREVVAEVDQQVYYTRAL